MRLKGESEDYKCHLIHFVNDDLLNKYVITSHQHKHNSLVQKVGRLVQVRLSCDESVSVLIRHPNGDLIQHVNQSYYMVKDDMIPYLDEVFKDIPLDDTNDSIYSIKGGKNPRKGFIISGFKNGDFVNEYHETTVFKIIDIDIDGFYYLVSLDGLENITTYADEIELHTQYYRKLKIKHLLNVKDRQHS